MERPTMAIEATAGPKVLQYIEYLEARIAADEARLEPREEHAAILNSLHEVFIGRIDGRIVERFKINLASYGYCIQPIPFGLRAGGGER